jgi:hypothetical protein
MAILKTIQEVKNLLPRLLSGLSNGALMPNVDRATEKYLVPVVGDALVTEIETAYNDNTLTTDQTRLLPKMQLVVISGAYLDELAFAHATITDNGVRTAQTQNMPRVYGWEYKELKEGLQLVSLDALDVLLQYLQNNKASFTTWTTSEAFKQFDALLIKTAMEFDNIHKLVQPFRTFYGLKSEMANVQEQYIIPSIGTELFDRLNSATDLSDPEKVIRKQLQKAIAFYTIKRACEHYAVRIDQNGFTVVASGDQEASTAGRTQAAPGLVKQKMDACDRDGGNWLAKARNQLATYSIYPDEPPPPAFMEAFAKSPLVKYVQPIDRTTGNERRKIFRM